MHFNLFGVFFGKNNIDSFAIMFLMILIPLAIFLVGIVSGFFGAIAGGGGLISIPFLLFLGIPPQVALATNKFGGLGLSIGAIYKFFKEKRIVWIYAIGLSAAGILASLIGSRILIEIEPKHLNVFVAFLLIILAPTVFLSKNFGMIEKNRSPKFHFWGYFFYFIISILASIMGGFGAILISGVIYFFGLTIIKANATELISYTALSISATIIYMFNGLIDYKLLLCLFPGMSIGGYIGAHTTIRKGNSWVKIIFIAVIIFSALKLLI